MNNHVLLDGYRLKKIVDCNDGDSADVFIRSQGEWQLHDNVGLETVDRLIAEADEVYIEMQSSQDKRMPQDHIGGGSKTS